MRKHVRASTYEEASISLSPQSRRNDIRRDHGGKKIEQRAIPHGDSSTPQSSPILCKYSLPTCVPIIHSNNINSSCSTKSVYESPHLTNFDQIYCVFRCLLRAEKHLDNRKNIPMEKNRLKGLKGAKEFDIPRCRGS